MSMLPSFRVKLGPLRRYLDDVAVTEIVVNAPREAFVLRSGYGYMVREEVPGLDFDVLESLTRLIASYSAQNTNEEAPLLSASIPADLDSELEASALNVKKYRVQCVRPPATEQGKVLLAIRKQALFDVTMDSLANRGFFDHVNNAAATTDEQNTKLLELYQRGEWMSFLELAVVAKKNIIVSAGTNTGKTTLLNALMKMIPAHERIGTIEDAREVRVIQPNCFNLLYSRGGQGVAKVTDEELLRACMRLSPDRIMMGELRGPEAYAFLESTMSGHPGSLSTIHAGSPDEMWDRLVSYALRGSPGLSREDILALARRSVEVVIQLAYDKLKDKRYIAEIYYANAK